MAGSATHQWSIHEREFERHVARRGRRHAYETLTPRRTALVVVDMVPFFVDENPFARGIVPAINRLAAVLRDGGGTVAWIVPASDMPDNVEFFGADVASMYASSGGAGPIRGRIAAELDVGESDLLLEKSAPSAFFPGRCELDASLRAAGVDTVLVAGTVANVCCESTVRDASTLGYRTVMVADANAAVSDEHLNATLTTVYRSFGDVRPTDDLVALFVDQESSG